LSRVAIGIAIAGIRHVYLAITSSIAMMWAYVCLYITISLLNIIDYLASLCNLQVLSRDLKDT